METRTRSDSAQFTLNESVCNKPTLPARPGKRSAEGWQAPIAASIVPDGGELD